MKVCIAGGGKVGMYLAQSLLAHHHKVTIIEPQEALCRSLADALDVPVVCGDAISFDTLRTADVASCDAFVAVTGNDEDNLVACQIAKREFGVDRTVARASNPKNRELLHTLGVDTVVCGTDNLSHILEREIETDTIRQLLSLGGGTASLNEILLPEDFAFAGKSIKDIPIPGNAILVSITRDTEFIIPHGNTVLLPWENGKDWKELALLAKNRRIDVRFIEKMPLGKDKETEGVSNILLLEEMQASFGKAEPDGRSHGNGPAVYYRFPGFQGSVGFISAIHDNFCAGCNRLRMTAEGKVKPCLCYEENFSLKEAVRAGNREEIRELLRSAVEKKPQRHCFAHTEQITEQRDMWKIGG